MINFGFYNMDCMDGMKEFPDKFFDIAVVDPPYFSGPNTRRYYGRAESTTQIKRKIYDVIETWEVPKTEYFDELMRVSKNQIIWGCNYFDYHFGSGRIVWDKCRSKTSFSKAEIAYCSLHNTVEIFRYMWDGMMQGKSIDEGWIQQGNKKLNECRIHPTQKPVNLYQWIAREYIKLGWKVLDTHVGSASSLIAYHEAGIRYVGFEIDEKMYHKAMKRLEAAKSQMSIFDLGVSRI